MYFKKRNCRFLVMRNGKWLWWRSYTYQRISFRFPDTDDISFDVKWCSLYQILQMYQTIINFQITFLQSTNTNCIIKDCVPDFTMLNCNKVILRVLCKLQNFRRPHFSDFMERKPIDLLQTFHQKHLQLPHLWKRQYRKSEKFIFHNFW